MIQNILLIVLLQRCENGFESKILYFFLTLCKTMSCSYYANNIRKKNLQSENIHPFSFVL